MRVRKEHVTHPQASFRYLRFETAQFAGGPHRHPQLELTWIERGTGMRLVGDSVVPFASGDLVLIGAELPHAWLSAGTAVGARACVLQFPVALLEQPLLPELASARPVAEAARLGLSIHGACARAVKRLLASMDGETACGRLASLVRILGLLATAGGELTRIASSPMRVGPAHGHGRRIDRVTDWVARHLAGELRVADAARLVGVTPAAFSRFFRRETGKAFSTYINDVRCGAACLELRQSDRPIARIAEACGFASISHFNRQFRLRFGMTPRDYRLRPLRRA